MATLSTLVPTNYVLTSGVNSAMTWSNVLTLSTVNASTSVVSSVTANSIGANVVTLNSTLSVSTLTARTVNYSSIVGSSISSNSMTLSLTNTSTQNTQIYQVATTNPTTSYTAIQATHVSTGTTNNALVLNPSGGNVGVGTTAPTSALQVNASNASATTTLTVSNAANANTGFGAQLAFDNFSGNATLGSIAALRSNNAGNFSAHMAFSVNTANATSLAERMRITADGNVGIGTTTPAATLDVAGNIRTLNPIYTVKASVTATTGSATTVALMDINASGTYLVSVFGVGGGFVTIAGVAMVIMYYDGSSSRFGLMNSMSAANFAWTSINPGTGVITFTQNSGYTAVCNFSALRIA